jgi:hypothetical protein
LSHINKGTPQLFHQLLIKLTKWPTSISKHEEALQDAFQGHGVVGVIATTHPEIRIGFSKEETGTTYAMPP